MNGLLPCIVACGMAETSALELRATAERYRILAHEGDDPILRAMLLMVADEFAREAADVEARMAGC